LSFFEGQDRVNSCHEDNSELWCAENDEIKVEKT